MKLFSSILLVITLFSCSKPGSSPATDRSLENLTDKYFIMTNSVSDPAYPIGNGVSTTDLYHDWYKDECVLDDLRMFKSTGQYLNDNGATKCDPAEPQTATLSWRFIENNTKIETTQEPYKDTLTILINDGTTLKYTIIKRWAPGGNSSTYLWTETWQKHN